MTWKNRRQCTMAEQAVLALADAAVTKADTIVNGNASIAGALEGRMAEFAEYWGIPFNERALYKVALDTLGQSEEESDGTRGWYASLC